MGSASGWYRTHRISGRVFWRPCSCCRCGTKSFVEMFYMKRAACLWRGRARCGESWSRKGPARLRARQGGHGAIPRVVTAGPAATSRLPSRRGILRQARYPSPPATAFFFASSAACSIVATGFCKPTTAFFRASICRLPASNFCRWSAVSLLIVCCRKSTLLCRRQVRRPSSFRPCISRGREHPAQRQAADVSSAEREAGLASGAIFKILDSKISALRTSITAICTKPDPTPEIPH